MSDEYLPLGYSSWCETTNSRFRDINNSSWQCTNGLAQKRYHTRLFFIQPFERMEGCTYIRTVLDDVPFSEKIVYVPTGDSKDYYTVGEARERSHDHRHKHQYNVIFPAFIKVILDEL